MNQNQERLKLMCVMAHPDDETLGTGGVLAKYASEGVETYLVTATRGEAGWPGDPDQFPGAAELGRMRQKELEAAARVLGLREVAFLNYIDGQLSQAPAAEAAHQIAGHLRRLRPQVVITFDPFGTYGHPDHIAISQFTIAALVLAASSEPLNDLPPHVVSKLYYFVERSDDLDLYQKLFGELSMNIDGVRRSTVPWPDWASSTLIDTRAWRETVWQAVACHQTQFPAYGKLVQLPWEERQQLWSEQRLYRAYGLTGSGRALETDLFQGLRQQQAAA